MLAPRSGARFLGALEVLEKLEKLEKLEALAQLRSPLTSNV